MIAELSRDEWKALWHHLCARLAELQNTARRLDQQVPGWGAQRLGPEIHELTQLAKKAHANARW